MSKPNERQHESPALVRNALIAEYFYKQLWQFISIDEWLASSLRTANAAGSSGSYTVTLCERCGKPKPCAYVILNDVCECDVSVELEVRA